jgi:hypothetical protein
MPQEQAREFENFDRTMRDLMKRVARPSPVLAAGGQFVLPTSLHHTPEKTAEQHTPHSFVRN